MIQNRVIRHQYVRIGLHLVYLVSATTCSEIVLQ